MRLEESVAMPKGNKHRSPTQNQKQQNPTGGHQESTGAHQPKDYPLIPLTNVVKELKEAYCAHQHENDINQAKQLLIQRLLCVITFGAFAAAAYYAYVSHEQWQDLRHNFAVEQRAWVRSHIVIPDTPVSGFDVSIMNVGKSPATGEFVNMVYEILDADQSPNFSFDRMHRTGALTALFPTDYTTVPAHLLAELTQAQRESLARGQSYVVLFGVIRYSDQFGPHWTRFCDWKSYGPGPRGFNARACTNWNGFGDGLPKF